MASFADRAKGLGHRTDQSHDSTSSRPETSQRASYVSAISDYEPNQTPYDPPKTRAPALVGRPSLVSVDSRQQLRDDQDEHDENAYPGARKWKASGAYSPLTGNGSDQVSRTGSLLGRGSRKKPSRMPESIDEEGYDLSLLSAAAPIDGSGATGTTNPQVQNDDDHPGIAKAPTFDLTLGFLPHNEEYAREWETQEANGHLSGGLGQGWEAEEHIKHDEIATSPIIERSLSRSRSHFGSRKLTRARALQEHYQNEANKSGKVTRVVMDEPPAIPDHDLSNMTGPANMLASDRRAATFPSVKMERVETFFPQPNWKPFPMRLPWLVMLVVVSIGLAITSEMLYQAYRKDGILQFKSPDDVSPGQYFAVKFGPTLLAVVYGVLWQFTDFEVRRLEAYYQLSKPGGALAGESINVDYVTCFAFWRPFKALRHRHWAVTVSSLATIFAVSLVPTFAAASITLTPDREAREADADIIKVLRLKAEMSRLLTSTICLCAAAGVVLLSLLQRRRSGLPADVRGIAGLASMAVVSHILTDFKDMDTAKHKDIHDRLKKHRYILRNSSLAPDEEKPVRPQDQGRNIHGHMSESPHPLMMRLSGLSIFIILVSLFIVFVPCFLFTPADVVTSNVPWLVTLMAVGLKLAWHGLETGVKMMEPYYILSKRHALPKTLTLDYTALPFGYLPVQALFNGHWVVFFVGFGTVMAEFLTVLVTGLATVDGQNFVAGYEPDKDIRKGVHDTRENHRGSASGTETYMSFFFSLSLTMFILVYMLSIAILVLNKRRHPFLPRQPNTIASVLAYIHQSKMIWGFVGTNKMTSAQIEKKLAGSAGDEGARGMKLYGLGWFKGRDGLDHCGVDEEELNGPYRHGVDYRTTNQPWSEAWSLY